MKPVQGREGPTLHEAMIAVMVRCRQFTATAQEIAHWNERLALKPRRDGSWPDADQIRLRARKYPEFFVVKGTGPGAVIRLRRFGDAP